VSTPLESGRGAEDQVGAVSAGPPRGSPTPPAPAARAGYGLKAFVVKLYDDGLTGLAGMVAYNLLLSIFPLAFVALFIAGRVLASEGLERSVLVDLKGLFPSATEATLVDVLRRIQQSSTSFGIFGLIASIWVGSSFWGALDTAFCRIYHLPCRSWVRQKLFALGMLAVVLLFVAASVSVPTMQSILARGTTDLPFGLAHVRGLVFVVSLGVGLVLLFAALCAIYWRVPKGPIPWRCIWPGAAGATLAMGVVDYGFPLYLQNVSTIARLGSTLVFVLIGLLWFYVLAYILLAGAALNELRFEREHGPREAPAAG
jgi:membrane protein